MVLECLCLLASFTNFPLFFNFSFLSKKGPIGEGVALLFFLLFWERLGGPKGHLTWTYTLLIFAVVFGGVFCFSC